MGCICSEPVWNIEANVILRYLLNDHEELKLMQRRISICIKRGVGLLGSGSFLFSPMKKILPFCKWIVV